jgi:predicted nucleic acid-binding protein
VLLAGLLWHGVPQGLLAQVRAATLGLVSSPARPAEWEVIISRAKFDAILTRSEQ